MDWDLYDRDLRHEKIKKSLFLLLTFKEMNALISCLYFRLAESS